MLRVNMGRWNGSVVSFGIVKSQSSASLTFEARHVNSFEAMLMTKYKLVFVFSLA